MDKNILKKRSLAAKDRTRNAALCITWECWKIEGTRDEDSALCTSAVKTKVTEKRASFFLSLSLSPSSLQTGLNLIIIYTFRCTVNLGA